MTTADFVPLLTSNLRKLSAGQWREGDVVFYFAPGKGAVRSRAGYTVLASATEHYVFDPYEENSQPHARPLPQNVQLWYHASVPVDPKDLHLEDVLSLLWSSHRKALLGKDEHLLEHGVLNPFPGEVVLQERLDGYLALDLAGQEEPYSDAELVKKRRWLPPKKRPLIKRPFTERRLLRLVAADPKRLRFFSR